MAANAAVLPAAPTAAAAPSSTAELRVFSLVQRLKQPTTVPPSATHMRQAIGELKAALFSTTPAPEPTSHDLPAVDASAPSLVDHAIALPPSSVVIHFCSSHQYGAFVSWLWRNAASGDVAAWSHSVLADDVFIWFDAPIPASDAFLALVAATRSTTVASTGGGVTATTSAVQSVLTSCLQRFVDHHLRISDLLGEVCAHEAQRGGRRAAALSPQSQALVDQLCSFPDVLANAMQTRVPYALSHRAWYTAIVTQTVALMHAHAQSADAATYLTPLASVLTKLTRLGQQGLLLDGLMAPLVSHIQQLRHSPSPISLSLAASPSSSSSVVASISPLVSIYAAVVQGVGVQALESFVTAVLQWLGSQLQSSGDEPNDTEADRDLLSVMPSLFPLSFFNSSSFFSLLLTRRLFISKATLSAPALRVLIEYLAFISRSRLELVPPLERTSAQLAHETLLDTVLLEIVQVWSGGEQGSSGGSQTSTSMASESQLNLAMAIQLLLIQLEKVSDRAAESSSAPLKPAPKKKSAEDDEETSFTTLGSFASSPAVSFILTGVHSRLSSPLLAVRRSAMKIAKAFSRMMGGKENEIDFEGEDDAIGMEPEPELDAAEQANQNRALVLNPATIINPQHLGQHAATGAATLVPHSLEDDERDLRKVKLPAFLRDALELLHKNSESFDHLEAALEALPALIRKHPADLQPLAGQLTSALLNAGSNVFMETHKKLAAWRLQALVELCCVTRPDARVLAETVHYIVQQFYSSNYSLGTKLELLDVLRMAAEKLADMDGSGDADAPAAMGKPLIHEVAVASKLTPVNTPSYSSSSSAQSVSATLANHQAIIRERVEKRTKRWGNTKQAAVNAASGAVSTARVKTYSVNRFTPVAHLFFYPLMKQIDQPAAMVLLQQHDSLLLIRLLHTLSAFLPCSSGLAQTLPLATRGMAKVLMEYLLINGTRIGHHAGGAAQPAEQIGIRRMIFFALSRILVTYNEKLFADDFPRELPELVSWLTDSVQRDRDHECRQLASASLHFLKQLLGNPFESMFKAEASSASHTAVVASAQLPPLRF